MGWEGAAIEPGTCHHNGPAASSWPSLASRVPISRKLEGGGGGHCVASSAHYTPSSRTGLFFPRRPGRPEPVTRHWVAGRGTIDRNIGCFSGGDVEARGLAGTIYFFFSFYFIH